MDNEIVWIVSGFGRMSLGMWLVRMLNNTKKWQNDFMCEKRVRGRCLARD